MTDEVESLELNEFEPNTAMVEQGGDEDKSAADLSPVFDVPVSISAVLGRASMSVQQLLQLGSGHALSRAASGQPCPSGPWPAPKPGAWRIASAV